MQEQHPGESWTSAGDDRSDGARKVAEKEEDKSEERKVRAEDAQDEVNTTACVGPRRGFPRPSACALCVVGTVHRFSLLFSFLLLGLLLLLLRRNQRSLLLYHQADKIYTCMRRVSGNDRRLVDIR